MSPRHSLPQWAVCSVCEVRKFALFGALDEQGLARLHSRIEPIAVDAETRIYPRGERGDAVYTIRSGVVRFERATEGGERRIVRLAGLGDLIGQEALVGHGHADDAIACTDVRLCRLPCHMVLALGEAEPPLLRELMLRWQRALDDSAEWLVDLTMGSARGRMLRLLAKLSEYAGPDGIAWLPSRQDIGVMLNMRLETASRHISGLRREGLIETLSTRTVRLDAAALREALSAADVD
jgi:CRP/FNR family transcriptional regulator